MMSDLSLEIIGDFAVVWLLSPKKTFSAAPRSGLSQFISRLPGHSLQVEHCPAPLSYIASTVEHVLSVIWGLGQPRLTQGFPVTNAIDDSSFAMHCRLGRSL